MQQEGSSRMNRCEVIKGGAGRDVGDGVSGEGAERVGMMERLGNLRKCKKTLAIPCQI